MSVELYFGLPGCGKTTLMTKIAIDALKDRNIENVYCNVKLSVPGVTFIDNSCIGPYYLHDGVVLIDEATLFADSRNFTSFDDQKKKFFLLHRHMNLRICLFTQQWDGIDRKIRVITDRVYYVYKDILTGFLFTRYYRIPYGIIIPDPKNGNDRLGEIIQGYCKPNFFVRLFSPWVFRPRYYKYFDSWELPPDTFKDLPPRYKPYRISPDQIKPKVWIRSYEFILDKWQQLKLWFKRLLKQFNTSTK